MNERKNVISKTDLYMNMAELISKRSKDPRCQVGCVIISPQDRIMSLGYNGFPNNCDDKDFNWAKDDDTDNKYLYVVHAELNAILNYRGESLEGCTLYVTLFPCNECTKAIIQSGISKVIYKEIRNQDSPSHLAALKMFKHAGIECEQYIPNYEILLIDNDHSYINHENDM